MIQISANEWQVFIAERLSLKTGHSFHVIYTLGIFDVKRILCQIPDRIDRIGSAGRPANLAPCLTAIYNKFVRGPARFLASTFRTELGSMILGSPRHLLVELARDLLVQLSPAQGVSTPYPPTFQI
jgi:hypothetical protein